MVDNVAYIIFKLDRYLAIKMSTSISGSITEKVAAHCYKVFVKISFPVHTTLRRLILISCDILFDSI